MIRGVGNIYPLTESLLLVPIFDRFRRLSADACFLLLNTNGTVAGQLQDLEPKSLKLDKLKEFHFAVNQQNQVIYFKGENAIYLFGFNGACLDKIILEGKAKPLAAFQLIGNTINGNLLFFDRKNFHFLQMPSLKPLDDSNGTIIENALTDYKKHKFAKPAISAKKVKDDKHIYLHKVDHPEIIENNFEWIQEKFEHSIEKSESKFPFFYYLFRDAQQLLQMSVLHKRALEDQQHWFRYGLNSISEFCRLVCFEGETKEAVIDDMRAFEITVEPSREYVNVTTALWWAIIARDTEKQKIIAGSPVKNWVYREADWEKNTFMICFLKLIKEYFLTGNFNISLFDAAEVDLEKNKYSLGPDVKQKFALYLKSRFLNAFKSLIDNEETEFNSNFKLAIQAHKEVWSQKKALNRGGTPLCREDEGFLSWDCTALAAIAYDKGWKLDISSDYVPQWMVNGSINQ